MSRQVKVELCGFYSRVVQGILFVDDKFHGYTPSFGVEQD